MTMIQRLSFGMASTLVCVLSAPSFAVPASTGVNTATSGAGKVVAPLKATLGAFRVSKAPVLLPTWVPTPCLSKTVEVGPGPFTQGYQYSFGQGSADTILFGGGGIGKAGRSRKHVKLSGGRDACLVFYKNVRCLEWQQGKFCYQVGVPDNPKNDPDMIKVANSLISVPPSVLNTAPRGEDSIVKYFAHEREMNDQSARAEIGTRYKAGLDAASRGEHKKAEKLYRDLIAKWKQCDEMPPISQIQMALAQTLIKLGRADEAAQIKKSFAAQAEADEQRLVKKLEEQKAKLEGIARGTLDYNYARAWLGQCRQELANFYIAVGKYNEAESQLKTGFNDIASIYGRGASDCRLISDDYAVLLRTTGRSDEPARELLVAKRKGHSPVKMTLKPDTGLKKNGAEAVVLVIEDEYGAPSGEQWFTKKGSLQGMKGEAVVWQKPIKFDHFINMDQCAISCDGSSVFTLSTTLGFNKYTHKFVWDGNKVSLRESKLVETKN